MTPPKEELLSLLRLWSLAQGADLCDRCGETIWPEIELVRCDFCHGKYGPPPVEAVLAAQARHRDRIAAYEREMREDYAE